MKKILLYPTLALCACLGCEKSTEGQTRTTFYANLSLEGPSHMQIDRGSTYHEPGYSADIDGNDATDQVEVTSTVNTAASGVYSVRYSISNADGFANTASRTVVVADPDNAPEGLYFVNPASYRLYGGANVAYGSAFPVYVIGRTDGNYNVNDMFAGWYCLRAGYGPAYEMRGVVSIAEGVFTSVSTSITPWGDTAIGTVTGTHDATAGVIAYVMNYASGMEFHVSMIKTTSQ